MAWPRARSAPVWWTPLVPLVLLASVACRSGSDAAQPRRCELGDAFEVARSDVVRFDAIALSAVGDAVLAAWSELSGTYGRRLDADGRPRGPIQRLRERCEGGLALADADASDGQGEGGAWLACSEPNAEVEHSALTLMRLDARLAARTQRVLGLVGRDGAGVTMVRDGPRVLVGWHDGTPQAYAARLAIHTGEATEHFTLSDPAFAAGAPAVAAHHGHWLAAFSETRISLPETATRIVLRSDRHPSRVLRASSVDDPAPALAWDKTSAWIAYRERNPRNPRPNLFTARLTTELKLAHIPRQIGRANSEGPPTVLACPAVALSLLPRNYASELYIGIHALDATLRNLGAGHQSYANSRDFVLSTAACVGGNALILNSERKAPADPGASLIALPFHCAR